MNKQLFTFFICTLVICIFSCTKEVQQSSTVSASENEDATDAVLDDSILYKNAFTKNTQGWMIEGDAQGSSSEPT